MTFTLTFDPFMPHSYFQAGNRLIMPNGPRVTAPGQRIVTLSNGQQVLTVQSANATQKFANTSSPVSIYIGDSLP